MIDEAQIRGVSRAMGDALARQREQFEMQVAVLELRLASLERLLGVEPAAIAPAASAPARH